MPNTVSLILGALLLLVGVALATLAVLGGSGRLRRNRVAGVRTEASLRSDEAFAVGNRAAAVPLGAAGALVLLAGAVLLVAPLVGGAGALGWVVLGVCVVGAVLLTGVGGLVGDRAAAAVVPPEPAGCGGVCAGCSLVEGCAPAALTEADSRT